VSITLTQLESAARTISSEHRKAIADSETISRTLAKADVDYHKHLAVQIAMAKHEFGATVAEALAKGHPDVLEAKERRDIAAAEDRATMERIRLARDDRQALLSIAGWSRASEAVE
jgi:hypothetical protein